MHKKQEEKKTSKSNQDKKSKKKASMVTRSVLSVLLFLLFLGAISKSALASSSSSSPPVTVDCLGGTPFPAQLPSNNKYFPNIRPPPASRKYTSPAVERVIAWARTNIADQALAELYVNTYPNTLDTTLESRFYPPAGKNLSYVITGDIDAMWLRDSHAQVLPYIALVGQDSNLQSAAASLIQRQLYYVQYDQFANAYNGVPSTSGHRHDFRKPPVSPVSLVFEGKYEVDSLCAVLKLIRTFCAAAMKKQNETTTSASSGSLAWLAPQVGGAPLLHDALSKVLAALQQMQSPQAKVYQFMRHNPDRDYFPHDKVGFTGMVRSAFRPSDDQCTYDFLVPSNLFLAVELRHLVASAASDPMWADIKATATTLRNDILGGIARYAIDNATGVLSYEVDGLGNRNVMDDANMPSLLSLPALGVGDEEIANFNSVVYPRTRKSVLEKRSNPYFFSGPLAAGIGSPHTPVEHVWPLSLSAQLVTLLLQDNTTTGGGNGSRSGGGGSNDVEILGLLDILKRAAVGSGVMHESFFVYNTSVCTRNWFAWANSYFGSAINTLIVLRPDLVLAASAPQVPSWFPRPVI